MVAEETPVRWVFLDVGAHVGTISRAVLASPYPWAWVVGFEPQTFLCDHYLATIDDPRFTICPFGLGLTTGPVTYYRGKTLGSLSPYATKRFKHTPRKVPGQMVRASEWFREHLAADDHVVMQINAEGAECDVLEDLFATEEWRKVYGLCVIFDIRKVPPERHRQAPVQALLSRIPKVFVATEETIGDPRHWLDALV